MYLNSNRGGSLIPMLESLRHRNKSASSSLQTRKQSFTESVVNVLIGYGVAVGSQILIFPFFGIHVRLSDNFIMGVYFTVISIIRSYLLRRFFNGYHYKINKEATQ